MPPKTIPCLCPFCGDLPQVEIINGEEHAVHKCADEVFVMVLSVWNVRANLAPLRLGTCVADGCPFCGHAVEVTAQSAAKFVYHRCTNDVFLMPLEHWNTRASGPLMVV